MALEEPTVILDEITKAIRSNKRLDLEFKDHYGATWILSMKQTDQGRRSNPAS
ncbi:hypothetical protein SEA_HUWBERT_12 [Microbacterium phage Huwbert]|nr:hypothetical protein SEA_HUWBERT_12 [Microbacterium phage Huwbert]